MQDNLVSVIMPMHNSARFVKASIESVIGQTYAQWELLVVDDGSSDNSCDIVEEMMQQDDRIRLFRIPKSAGLPSVPRNFGISQSTGRYIAFLDSDDIWLRNKLAQQLPLFSDIRTAVVYSDYEKIDEFNHRSARVVRAPGEVDYPQLLKGNVIGNLTGIFDVSKVGKNYFLDIHHEDYAFWLSVLKNGHLARNTRTITALYREHSGSLSSQKLKTMSWHWNVLRQVEHISLPRAIYYFACYAVKALRKSLI